MLLPLLVQYTSERDLIVLLARFCMAAIFQVILQCLHDPSFQQAPSNSLLFQTLLQLSFTQRSRRILSPRCVPPRLVLVPSRTTDHQEFTRTICAGGLRCRAPSLVPCFFKDSSKIHIRIIWAQQRFQRFNFHFKFLLSSRYCFVLAMFVLSLAHSHLVLHLEMPLLLLKR